MRESLGLTIVIYCVALAALCAVAAISGRRRPAVLTAGLVVLEAAAVGQALLDGLALARGDHGSEVLTNLGYLLTSMIVLPVTACAVRLDPGRGRTGIRRLDAGRWGSATLATGCLLLAVVSVRLQHTLVAGSA